MQQPEFTAEVWYANNKVWYANLILKPVLIKSSPNTFPFASIPAHHLFLPSGSPAHCVTGTAVSLARQFWPQIHFLHPGVSQ